MKCVEKTAMTTQKNTMSRPVMKVGTAQERPDEVATLPALLERGGRVGLQLERLPIGRGIGLQRDGSLSGSRRSC